MQKTYLRGMKRIMKILTSCQESHDSAKAYLKLVKQIEI